MGIDQKTLAALREAHIPVPLQGLMGQQGIIDQCVAQAVPAGVTSGYTGQFRAGNILRATDSYKMSGKGLWLVGSEAPDIVAAAITQSLLLDSHIENALFINVLDFIEAESPNGDSLGDRRFVDLLVLQGVGDHHQSLSGYSDSLLYGLLTRRYARGLPTLVTTEFQPDRCALPAHLIKKAFIVVTFNEG